MKPPAPSLRALSLLPLLVAMAACSSQPAAPVNVNLAVINDLHGHFQPTEQPYRDPTAPDGVRSIKAGGIDVLGGVVDQLRKDDAQTLVVGNGDLIGGSPALSAMWADEPTIMALKGLGLQLSSLGNHELDNGKDELQRMIGGGCVSNRPEKACRFETGYKGTGFPYLAANLIDTSTGKPLLPAYRVLEAHGQKVAFVGAVLKDLPDMVSAQGMRGLQVKDEADAINALVPALKAQGVVAIVALIHQGGASQDAWSQNDCQHLQGPIVDLAQRLDPAVDVIASAHTHRAYTCRVNGRPVFQGGSYGQFVSHIQLQIDPARHRVVDVRMTNLQVDASRYAPNPELANLRKAVEARSQSVLQRPIARLGVPRIGRLANPAGETPLGDLVADAQREAARGQGAQIAFMNRGGLRDDLAPDAGQGLVTYAQIASIHPFRNTLTLFDLNGAQLRALLESQWRADGSSSLLQVSAGLSYEWDAARALGQRIVPGSLKFEGRPVVDTGIYRIVTSNFLADGGDGFALFKDGVNRLETDVSDLQALEQYLTAQDKAGTPAGRSDPQARITRR